MRDKTSLLPIDKEGVHSPPRLAAMARRHAKSHTGNPNHDGHSLLCCVSTTACTDSPLNGGSSKTNPLARAGGTEIPWTLACPNRSDQPFSVSRNIPSPNSPLNGYQTMGTTTLRARSAATSVPRWPPRPGTESRTLIRYEAHLNRSLRENSTSGNGQVPHTSVQSGPAAGASGSS